MSLMGQLDYLTSRGFKLLNGEGAVYQLKFEGVEILWNANANTGAYTVNGDLGLISDMDVLVDILTQLGLEAK